MGIEPMVRILQGEGFLTDANAVLHRVRLGQSVRSCYDQR